MKIEIERTETKVVLDGVECRVWNGTIAGGGTCQVFVHRVLIPEDCNVAQFRAGFELIERVPPENFKVL